MERPRNETKVFNGFVVGAVWQTNMLTRIAQPKQPPAVEGAEINQNRHEVVASHDRPRKDQAVPGQENARPGHPMHYASNRHDELQYVSVRNVGTRWGAQTTL